MDYQIDPPQQHHLICNYTYRGALCGCGSRGCLIRAAVIAKRMSTYYTLQQGHRGHLQM